MDWIDKILVLIEPKTIASNFQKYIRIYSHPYASYRKVLTTRTSSLEYLTLHIIYYGIVLFLISKSIFSVFTAIFLELIITLIPFLVFLTPFLIAKKAIKLKNRANRLFRIILLIKVQLIPIFALTIILANSTKNNSIYYLSENLIWIIWLAIMIIPPLILSKKLIQKICWIIGNYIAFSLFIILSSISLYYIMEEEETYNKYISFTPNLEFLDFQSKFYGSDELIIDSLYLAEFRVNKDGRGFLSNTQFVTGTLHSLFLGSQINQLIEVQLHTDSLLSIVDTNHISKKMHYELQKKNSSNIIDTLKLLKLRQITNQYFYDDLRLVQTFRESTTHERNRIYYTTLYDYMKKYESTYMDTSMITLVFKKMNFNNSIKISDNKYLVLTTIDPIIYEPYKSDYLNLEKQFESKFERSNVIYNILFYPFKLIEKANKQ